jgi:hypothetical protein
MPVVGLRLEDGSWRDFPAGDGKVTRAIKELVKRYVSGSATLRLL